MSRRFTVLNGSAIVVGGLAGLAAVLLRYAIDFVQHLAFLGVVSATAREENQFLISPWGALVVLVPTAGGLLIGLVRRFWSGMRQHGVTEVMAAVQAQSGVLKAKSSLGHALVSAITVGTGGSTGREGPIGYIGATLGSTAARRLGFSARDVKVLLGCGFSAGIAASFNTPLGGVLMALELVVPEFSTHAFIPLVVATVVGVAVGKLFIADQATFDVPDFVLASGWELVSFALLGLLCGLAAVGFIRLMTTSYRLWSSFKVPEIARPALGGFLVGAMGYAMLWLTGNYHVFGTGYATITLILTASPERFTGLLGLLALLLVMKPLATSITVGSGGGGGMFSVSLFQGVVVGGLAGWVMWTVFPGSVSSPAAYALVGMAAFYAAATRATLTAIVMLTELTRDYAIVLPVMLAGVVADAVSVRMSRESLYTIKLTQKGIHYEHDRTQSPLDFLKVKDVMQRDVHSLPDSILVGEAFNRMLDLGHTGYPVVDQEGRLKGVMSRRDISLHLQGGKGATALAELMTGRRVTAFPEEPLFRARDRMHKQDVGRLVVVDPEAPDRILGILTRSDLLRAEAERDVEHEDAWSQ
ncbi:MAG: chloride channel protein family [Thermoplasmata archaeon]|jgi:CIC family chloride channel protein|nr:chloride channel protein family [Thermoplasmata archaeon]